MLMRRAGAQSAAYRQRMLQLPEAGLMSRLMGGMVTSLGFPAADRLNCSHDTPFFPEGQDREAPLG